MISLLYKAVIMNKSVGHGYLLFLTALVLSKCAAGSSETETPIIGILSQEAYLVSNAYPDAHSFITASYVKILESSGARAMPIWIGQNDEYYERVVKFTNGVLFPGGGTYFNETGGYGEAAKKIYDIVIRTNRQVHYPLLGICLGMQALLFAAAGGQDIRQDCLSKNVALPLEFAPGFESSRLFSNASQALIDDLKSKNITYNYHRYCILESALEMNNLLNNWRILARNKDSSGLEFVSAIEHTSLPLYGIQYHPEKNNFEFHKPSAIPHSPEAIISSQYIANFFVNECRKNNHTFPDIQTERMALIYNYNPVYSAANTSYEQLYLFHEDDYNRNYFPEI